MKYIDTLFGSITETSFTATTLVKYTGHTNTQYIQ